MIYYLLFIFLSPIFLAYVVLCFIVPFFCIKSDNVMSEEDQEQKEHKVFVIKDNIHSDFVFHSTDWNSIFITEKKYIVIGWGDRKIFLETKSWSKLKIHNFIKAFLGMNDSVVRIKFIDRLPERFQTCKIDKRQFELIKNHIMSSFVDFQEIKKEDSYCEDGIYYKSKLKYNCKNTCNNWVNTGLYKAKLTKRTWAPLSHNVKISSN